MCVRGGVGVGGGREVTLRLDGVLGGKGCKNERGAKRENRAFSVEVESRGGWVGG